jgi:HD-GYP domain-containing protein (c-di-GMP phosphodiesterase class II)
VPLLLSVDELNPGMQLVDPIVADGRVMMQAARDLSEQDIAALQRRFPLLRVRIREPDLDSVTEFHNDERDRDIARTTQREVSTCMAELYDRFADRASVSRVQIGALRRTARDLTEFLEANPVSAALADACIQSDAFLSVHAGNVFFLSMLLALHGFDYVIRERQRQAGARRLRDEVAEDLVPLGLGAMLSDLGLTSLTYLLSPSEPLSVEERLSLLAHPGRGGDMLPKGTSAMVRMVVRDHHENCNGTGYPRQVGDDRLHVFARIVRIADAFDTATSREIFPQARSSVRALWEMTRGPCRARYDAELLSALASLIQPFPIGSKLRLSDGRYAAVVAYNQADPFDPVVIIAFDVNGRRVPRAQLDGPLRVSQRPGLRLAAMDDEDLAYLYDPPAPVPAETPLEFTSLFTALYP